MASSNPDTKSFLLRGLWGSSRKVSCIPLAGCPNQAFQKGKVIGLQFHMESSVDSIVRLIRNCSDELVEGEYVHMGDEILSQAWQIDEMNRTMFRFLDEIEKRYGV